MKKRERREIKRNEMKSDGVCVRERVRDGEKREEVKKVKIEREEKN